MRILKEAEGRLPLAEVARRHGVAEETVHRWRAKYGGMEVGVRSGCGSWRRRTGG